MHTDGRGNTHLGGSNTANLPGRVTIELDPSDSAGIALNVPATPMSGSERAVVKLGDFTLGQDTSANGTKDFGVLNAAGTNVAPLVNADGLPTWAQEIFHSTIPLIVAPTGSMGNNGVLTSGTANPLTYLKTYTWFPTGAIFTSSPAGWYWTVWTTTTAATVYQETWDGASEPQAVATPTPWVKTGPGAFTGPTTIDDYIRIPVAALGVDTIVRWMVDTSQTNNANVKTLSFRIVDQSGTLFATYALASNASVEAHGDLSAMGVAGAQRSSGYQIGDASAGLHARALRTLDLSAAWTFCVCVTKATATDVVVIEQLEIERHG